MYTRMLVPLDGSELSEEVLPYVRALGHVLAAPIELVKIYGNVSPELADPAHGLYIDQLATTFRVQSEDYLNQVKASFHYRDADVSCVAHEGEPPALIVDEAMRHSNTLIAMSTHGRSGVTRWAMGSVADRVVRHSGNPVLVKYSKPINQWLSTAFLTLYPRN